MSFSNTQSNDQCPPEALDFLVLACGVVVTLATIVWLLVYSHYGIDFTDESYYLVWMSNPWVYPVSASQFGFIYHPLYRLFHGDITLLRKANILIIYGLSWLLCIVFLRATINNQNQGLSWYRLPMLALAAIIATCSMVYLCPHGWLATPSYNSLNFQAMLVSSIGFLLAEKTVSPVSISGWLMIGIGGWLSFMAKPTSAAAFGLVIGVSLLLTSKFNLRLILTSLSTATALLIGSTYVIDGSLVIFLDRVKGGFEAFRLLGAGHINMFRIDGLLMESKELVFLAVSSAITFGVICLTSAENKARIMAGHSFALLFALISMVIIFGYLFFQASDYRVYYLTRLTLAVPLSTWAFYFFLMPKQAGFKVPRTQWGILLYFALLPHVFAFGTNQNYWMQGSMESLFWILAGLVVLMPAISTRSNWRILLPSVMSGQLITVFLLQVAMEQPYWAQPEPFRQYNTSLLYGRNESELMLPQALADYYRNVKKMAIQADFRPGAPMIDMTGEGPGTVYAIGAKGIGQAWMIGGFPGSNNLAIAMLNRVSCSEIAEAWLLVDPDNRKRLSPEILSYFGLSFEQDYELAAELRIFFANVARHGVPSQRVQLWKPIHPIQNTIAVCEMKRH